MATTKDHAGLTGRIKSTCTTVYDPDGKVAVLSVLQRGAATTGQIIVRSVVLSGSTISNDDSWYANIGADHTVGGLSAVYITKVLGWR